MYGYFTSVLMGVFVYLIAMVGHPASSATPRPCRVPSKNFLTRSAVPEGPARKAARLVISFRGYSGVWYRDAFAIQQPPAQPSTVHHSRSHHPFVNMARLYNSGFMRSTVVNVR